MLRHMLRRETLWALGTFLAMYLLVIAAARAQEAGGTTTIVVQPLIEWAVGIAATALLTLAAWAIHRLASWLGIRGDSELVSRLDHAIAMGIERGKDIVGAAAIARYGDVDVRSRIAAVAIQHVVDGLPDTLRRLGITDARVGDYVAARLPGQIGPATVVDAGQADEAQP